MTDTKPRKPRAARAIAASAATYKISGDKPRRRRSSKDATRAWKYYEIPEAWAVMNFRANSLSRCQLVVARDAEDPDAEPEIVGREGGGSDAEANEILDRFRDPVGGQAELTRLGILNLGVAGEAWVTGLNLGQDAPEDEAGEEEADGRPVGESWTILPRRAVDLKADPVKVTIGENQTISLREEDVDFPDFLARVWRPHPEYPGDADTELRALFDIFDEMLMIDQSVRAIARARVARAGILFLDSRWGIAPASATSDSGGDADEADNALFLKMVKHMSTPMLDESSAASIVPFLLYGDIPEGTDIKSTFSLLEFGREAEEFLLKRRADLVTYATHGFDAPPELVTGIGKTSHWNAWQIDESMFTHHLAPHMEAWCASLTAVYLRPRLRAAKHPDWQSLRVWYDPSRLVAKPNKAEEATEGVKLRALSRAAWRREKGFDDEDAPSAEEQAETAALERGQIGSDLVVAVLAKLLGVELPLPEPAPAPETPELPPGPEEEPEVGPPVDGPPTPGEGDRPTAQTRPVTAALLTHTGRLVDGAALGRKLADLDRSLRDRLKVASEAAIRRALDRAGARLRSRALRDQSQTVRQSVANVPQRLVWATLGPTLAQTLGLTEEEALQGALDDLGGDFDSWTRSTSRSAAMLLDVDPDDPELLAEQDERRSAAWLLLSAGLLALAAKALYDPTPADPEGEHEPGSIVATSLVRDALAVAGGQVDTDAPSASGLATGSILLDAAGVLPEAYVWDYGTFPRTPFEPHLNLDTVEGSSFDDAVFGGYYPGDHNGCACNLIPILAAKQEAA